MYFIPALSLDSHPARGAVRSGLQREPLCLPHTATCWRVRSPEKAQLMARPGSRQVPEDPAIPHSRLCQHLRQPRECPGSAEPRPGSSETHVHFTPNLIHLVLIYLHLSHQMQFCKRRSIAKRLFCLSLPLKGAGPQPQGPGGSSRGWRLNWDPGMARCLRLCPGPVMGAGMPEPSTEPDAQ